MIAKRLTAMSIKTRVWLLIALAVVGQICVSAYQMRAYWNGIVEQRQHELKHLVEMTRSIVVAEHAAQVAGRKSMQEAQDAAKAQLAALRYGADDYVWINDMTPRMVMHPFKPELNGQDLRQFKDPAGLLLFVAFVDAVRKSGSGFVAYGWPRANSPQPIPKLSYVSGFEPWGWVIGTGVYVDDLDEVYWKAVSDQGGLVLGIIVITAFMSLVLGRALSRSVNRMSEQMERLAGGDLDVMITGSDRKDEMGRMARALDVFKQNAIDKEQNALAAEQMRRSSENERAQREAEKERNTLAAERMRREADEERAKRDAERARTTKAQQQVISSLEKSLDQLSKGDLTCRIEEPFSGEFETLRTNFNTAIVKLEESFQTIIESANVLDSGARELSSAAGNLSRRTEEQAANLEETAASMEEIASTTKQNADNAAQANQLAISSRAIAVEGGNVVGKVISAMSRIETSSQKISDIISVIDEIAFQTNLLALNAAVEAARAGDAGKGFAVVASEVRSLAQRSSDAAKDIKSLIHESSSQVNNGVKLASDAGQSLSQIVDSIKKLTDIVSEISASSREQSTGVEEINKTVAAMDETTQKNSTIVEETAAACRMLEEQARALGSLMEGFVISRADFPEPARQAAPGTTTVVRLAS